MTTAKYKIVVEQHEDGFVAYPLGLAGRVVGQGDSADEAIADVQSAIRFHIETFGKEAFADDSPHATFGPHAKEPAMIVTLKAVVHEGKIELAEPATLPEGARVLVTLLPEDDRDFWMEASQKSLAEIWDNPEDDGYAKLLEK